MDSFTDSINNSKEGLGDIEEFINEDELDIHVHKKLLEMANKAGAIYRIDGTVLINRDIFDQYLEQFHEPSTLTHAEEKQ